MVAWKVADGSYIFINLGGVIAWNNDTTSGGVSVGEKARYGSYEFAMLRGSYRLTTLDILYHFLSNLYIPQWTKNYFTTVSPDLSSIVYHGNFNSDFEATFKVKYSIDASKLYGCTLSDGKILHINYEEIKKHLISKGIISSSDNIEDIKLNCDYDCTLKGTQEQDLSIAYSVGNNLSLTNYYSRLVALGESGFEPDENKVYLDGSTTTTDANGSDMSPDTIYIKSEGGFTPFKGKLSYLNGVTVNVQPDFLVIKRPLDKTKKATLYATATYAKAAISGAYSGDGAIAGFKQMMRFDTTNILYPNSQIFNA